MVIICSIWKQRNNKIWNKEVETRASVCERALTLITNWSNVQRIHSDSNSTAGSSAQQSTISALSWKNLVQAGINAT